MRLFESRKVLVSLCCVILAGCTSSEPIAPEVIQTVADQAAQVTALKGELAKAEKKLAQVTADSKNSLAALEKELEQAVAKQAAYADTQRRLQESTRRAEEELRRADHETKTLRKELQEVSGKLRLATAELSRVEADRQMRKRNAPVAGAWIIKNRPSLEYSIMFRADGTGVYRGNTVNKDNGLLDKDKVDYRFEYSETSDPYVYELRGKWSAGGEKVHGIFRVNNDGSQAMIEGWDAISKPHELVRFDDSKNAKP